MPLTPAADPQKGMRMTALSPSSNTGASAAHPAPSLRWDHSPVETLATRIREATGRHPVGSQIATASDLFAFTSINLVWIVRQPTEDNATALITKIRRTAESKGSAVTADDDSCNIDCATAMLDISTVVANALPGKTSVILDLLLTETWLIDYGLSTGADWRHSGTATNAFEIFFGQYLELSTDGFEAVPLYLTSQVIGCVNAAGSVDLPDDPELLSHLDKSKRACKGFEWNLSSS